MKTTYVKDQLRQYTTLEPAVFQTLREMVKRFLPLKYWSGKTVTSISVEEEFPLKLKFELPYFDLANRDSVIITTTYTDSVIITREEQWQSTKVVWKYCEL